MIIKCYNEKHNYLLFIDIEFNKRSLVQFAGLLFTKIEDETYQLMRSCNLYITTKVGYPFVEYTSITTNFLELNGVPLNDAIIFIEDDFLGDINYDDTLIISHGLRNDRLILQENGLNLLNSGGQPIDGYCTFKNSSRILQRRNKLTLNDVAREAGFYIHNAHNAFSDVWAEVAVFTYIRKIEEQNKQTDEEKTDEEEKEKEN